MNQQQTQQAHHFHSSPIDTQEEITINHIEEGEEMEEETGEIAIDVYRTESNITIIAPISGVAKTDISIKINENVLIISGKRLPPPMAGGNFVVKECFWGKFSRMLVLPSKVDMLHVKATFKNGILVIIIPVFFEIKEKIIMIDEE